MTGPRIELYERQWHWRLDAPLNIALSTTLPVQGGGIKEAKYADKAVYLPWRPRCASTESDIGILTFLPDNQCVCHLNMVRLRQWRSVNLMV